MYDSGLIYYILPTDFTTSLLPTEFLSQVWKQQEDSPSSWLATNNIEGGEHREKQREENKNKEKRRLRDNRGKTNKDC
jgi:hypothetical protein